MKIQSPELGVPGPIPSRFSFLASRLSPLRLLRDETGVTYTEYVVAAVALALAAVAASRAIAGVLISYLHRIYLVVTLPIP